MPPEIPSSIVEPKQLANLPQQKYLAGEVTDAICARRIDEPRVTKRKLLFAYETWLTYLRFYRNVIYHIIANRKAARS